MIIKNGKMEWNKSITIITLSSLYHIVHDKVHMSDKVGMFVW